MIPWEGLELHVDLDLVGSVTHLFSVVAGAGIDEKLASKEDVKSVFLALQHVVVRDRHKPHMLHVKKLSRLKRCNRTLEEHRQHNVA